jgi:hypothetical protein
VKKRIWEPASYDPAGLLYAANRPFEKHTNRAVLTALICVKAQQDRPTLRALLWPEPLAIHGR